MPVRGQGWMYFIFLTQNGRIRFHNFFHGGVLACNSPTVLTKDKHSVEGSLSGLPLSSLCTGPPWGLWATTPCFCKAVGFPAPK